MRDYWDPAVRVPGYQTDRLPPVGALIAYQRRPYRVLSHDPLHQAQWPDHEHEAWIKAGMPDDWRDGPVTVALQPLPEGDPIGGRVWSHSRSCWYKLLPEHYAVCVICGELAPCREITARASALREMERLDKLMDILPGCCWACAEPITHRQHAITFDGPNLLLPTAPPAPSFHLRLACRGAAARYEQQWIDADPTRRRSLLTLSCAGQMVWHADGTRECVGTVGSACPHLDAHHQQGHTACHLQTHGCARGCTAEDHPGIWALRKGRRRHG
jgi:hypothetical protein